MIVDKALKLDEYGHDFVEFFELSLINLLEHWLNVVVWNNRYSELTIFYFVGDIQCGFVVF